MLCASLMVLSPIIDKASPRAYTRASTHRQAMKGLAMSHPVWPYHDQRFDPVVSMWYTLQDKGMHWRKAWALAGILVRA